jgi:transcriptional regulator with XRE-family HTH domain
MPPARKSKPRGPAYAALGQAIEVVIAENPDIDRDSVAAESGMNISQINELVSGVANPTYRNLLRLCVGLQVEIDELMVLARELRENRGRRTS